MLLLLKLDKHCYERHGLYMKKLLKKIRWKKLIVIVSIIVVVIMAVRFAINRVTNTFAAGLAALKASTTTKVERRDIEKVISSSGTIAPLNTYEVTTLVEGEIIAADFEEGDYVEEGQILYQIATDELDNKISSAQTNVNRAEKNFIKAEKRYNDAVLDYEKALADYNDALDDYGDGKLLAEEAGIIKTLYVDEGDTIQNGSQIAEIYDNRIMVIELPFNASQVDQSLVGKKAEITLTDSFETLTGKVTKVSKIDEVLAGNRLVNKVTIEVKNPGGLTSDSIATAKIGDIYSSEEGKFTPITQSVIIADRVGKIQKLPIEEGSVIHKGDVILTMEQDAIENQLDPYKSKLDAAEDAMENAKDSMEAAADQVDDAKKSLEDILEMKEDYSITAPTSGQIVSKKALAGDTIAARSILCTIYDLSAVKFDMYVDELDVTDVKAGQKVKITADAFEDLEFEGIVTNVSLESSSSGGVTQYPVTVRINDRGNLLPGMNVTGEIIIERKENVIAVPTEALMRGDVVYVVDPSVTEAVGDVPAGFREVKVETGLTDGDFIEIISGLHGDEEVYVKRNAGTQGMIMEFGPGTVPMRGNNAQFQRSDRAPMRSQNVQVRPNGR